MTIIIMNIILKIFYYDYGTPKKKTYEKNNFDGDQHDEMGSNRAMHM